MSRGFTLLELLVALAIIAVLFAIFIPGGVHQGNHQQLASAAQRIGSALRITRMHAIESNQPDAFAVDAQKALYRPGNAASARALPKGLHISLYTAEEARLSASTGAIRFFPDGSSSGGGIVLNNGSDRYDVLVDWLTGRVSIHEHPTAR